MILSNANSYEKAITVNRTTLTDLTENTAYQLTGYIQYMDNGVIYVEKFNSLDALEPYVNTIIAFSEMPYMLQINDLKTPLNDDYIDVNVEFEVPEICEHLNMSTHYTTDIAEYNSGTISYAIGEQNPETGFYEPYDSYAYRVTIAYRYRGYVYNYIYFADDFSNWYKENCVITFSLVEYSVYDMLTGVQVENKTFS